MSNGKDSPYSLTAGEWIDMNKAIQNLTNTTEGLKEVTEKMNNTVDRINNTLENLPCPERHATIKTNRRLIYGAWTFIGLIILLVLGYLLNAVGGSSP